jgi:hypothetical protein
MLLVLAVATMIFFSVPLSFADNSTTITSAEFAIGMSQYFVNDQVPGISMDAAPYIDPNSGRTLVPVRYLGDALGATTAWDAGSQTVTLTSGSATISMVVGSLTLNVNGQTQTLDQAPVIQNGRTYLPARWVANALGYQVDWNAANRIVIIWPDGQPEPDIGSVIAQVNPAGNPVTSGGETINGYSIPQGSQVGAYDYTNDPSVSDSNTEINIEIWLNGQNWENNMAPVTESIQQQLADAQAILLQKFDAKTVQEVMSYCAPKTSLDYNLPLKTWKINGQEIIVMGGAGGNLVIDVEND